MSCSVSVSWSSATSGPRAPRARPTCWPAGTSSRRASCVSRRAAPSPRRRRARASSVAVVKSSVQCCLAMAVDIVGREVEFASIHAFLERPAEGPVALVLEGEAGIGKSTLWLTGVEAARERGFRALVSRPAEAERGLTHAGLGDLFENVLESVLPALPAPRRHALEVALLVEEDPDGFDPRTLGVAVRSALEVLAAEGPVVLAIDDVQWLDPSSTSALAFALRRLDDRSILLLLARRLGERAETPDLERAIPADRVERLHVGPLSLGAIHQLLQARLELKLPRPTLLRVHETSGGNPFYALELARALGADVDPTQPLRVPESLEGLVRARLDELPPATRESLLLAAAVGRPSAELFASLDVTEPVLDRALAARVIERKDGTIRFTHPLLASAVYHGVSAEERRRAHGRLALVVADPLDRARHLALSTESPDSRDRRCSRGRRGPGEHPRGTDRRRRARRARASAYAAGRPRRPASPSARCGARPAQRGRVDARAKDSRRSPRGDTSWFLARRGACPPC